MQAQPQHGVLVPYPPREQEARTLVAAPESVAWAATPDPMVIGVPSGTTIYRQSPSMLKPLEHAEYLFLLSALHAAVTSNEPVMAPQGQAVQLPLGYTSVSGENAPQYAQGLEQTLLGRSVVSQGHVTHLSSMVGGVLERTASTCPSEDVASSLDNVCPDTH